MTTTLSPFFHYSGITFNRSAVLVVSGETIEPENPGHEPYFRIILQDGVEWNVTATTREELLTKRAEFITALTT